MTDMYHDDYDFERLLLGSVIVSRLGLEAGCIGDLIPVCGLDEMNKRGTLGKLMNDKRVGEGSDGAAVPLANRQGRNNRGGKHPDFGSS